LGVRHRVNKHLPQNVLCYETFTHVSTLDKFFDQHKQQLKDVRKKVRFRVLTAASMKMAAFWDMAPCSLVEVD